MTSHPLTKDEFEERADVVVMKRKGNEFEVEQFPVYLTANQKEWNPAWIEPRDEVVDSTLAARKFEHDWTRLDGAYVRFRFDQLNGKVIYRARLRFRPDEIVIEGQRDIESRGGVKRVDRPRDYDPNQMAAFSPGVDLPAQPYDPLTVDPPSMDQQVRNLKSIRYFSNSFRAWCTHGLSTSGIAADGRTWVSIAPDQLREIQG